MANVGIIAEFNPFHLGHKHLIDSIKRTDNTITCVMSGNFVQRGDTAVFSKSDRCYAAIKGGADLVIELPTPWAMSAAQNFALGGVSLLNNLGFIDEICFGSECGEISKLEDISKLLISTEFDNKISERLKSGDTYAKIRTEILREYSQEYSEIIANPNNVLGIEYIIAAKRLGCDIKFKTIKRIGAKHDANCTSETASASYLREKIYSNNTAGLEKFITPATKENIEKGVFSNIEHLKTAILCDLRKNNTAQRYSSLPDISEGLENRIVAAVKNSATLEDLLSKIKTKRYPLARIRRIILSAFLGLKALPEGAVPPYIRVLGFNKKGEELIRKAAKKSKLPIITTAAEAELLSGFAKEIFEAECTASDIWALSLNFPLLCGNEYIHKLIKEN